MKTPIMLILKVNKVRPIYCKMKMRAQKNANICSFFENDMI